MKKLLISSCILLVACASNKHPNTRPIAQQLMPNKQQAHVIIDRDSTIIASPQDVLIEVDGQEVCVIPNGQTCEFLTSSGNKQVDIYAKTIFGNVDPTSIRLNFQAGKTYHFAVGPKDMTAVILFGAIGEAIADANNTSEQKGRFRIRAK